MKQSCNQNTYILLEWFEVLEPSRTSRLLSFLQMIPKTWKKHTIYETFFSLNNQLLLYNSIKILHIYYLFIFCLFAKHNNKNINEYNTKKILVLLS